MKRVITFLVGILILLYPLIVYFGLSFASLKPVVLVVAFIFVLRLILINRLQVNAKKHLAISKTVVVLLALLGLVLSSSALIFDSEKLLRLYPFMINILFLSIFLYTFFFPPTIIERFAYLIETPPFPLKAIIYMKKVTLVWIGFFILNGTIALFSAFFTSMEFWMLYNGLIAYILMGCIFIVEYLIRIRVKRKLS